MVAGGLLLAQEPPEKNPAANNPHLKNRESIRSGMALYRDALQRLPRHGCHRLPRPGPHGPAEQPMSTDERLFQTIRKGVPGTEMPSTDEPDDDILMIIAYLRNLGAVAAPEAAVGNVENGGRLFAAQCTHLPSRGGPRAAGSART